MVLITLFAGASAAGAADETSDARAKRLVARYEAEIRPLEIEVARLWWTANITGRDDDFRRKEEAETRLDLRLADPAAFAELQAARGQPPADPVLARQIEVIYLQHLAKQVEPELLKKILAKSNAIEQAFNRFRPKVDGKELTENEVRRILRESKDSARRQAVWEAGKRVGPVVERDFKQLVRLRNQAARKLGFADFHAMQLQLAEQSQAQVLRLFDDLDRQTRGPFHAAKAEIDAALARDYGIRPDQLQPWHYHDPFFQEPPEPGDNRFDAMYASLDILKLCREFYAGIGLPVGDILQRSDLYEKPGKSPHAFCTDMDHQGDVRVLANVVPGREWLATMLHELGHGVYSSKNIPASLPYALRTDAHALNTEGVAMMFERLADSAEWLAAMGVKVPDPQRFSQAVARRRRNERLIFSRWCQVMFRFEKELYGNPEQDLDRLWWDLVEKYQEIRRPDGRRAPDYAAKIHIVNAPCYYHNYMMGDLFAAQLHRTIAREALGGADPATAVYVGRKAVGRFMIERVFRPGRTLPWNRFVRFATGEELNSRAFAAEVK